MAIRNQKQEETSQMWKKEEKNIAILCKMC